MAHRVHRGLHRSEGRHQDHSDIRIPLFDFREQFRALHAFHAQIGEHDGIIFLAQFLERLVAAADARALMPAPLQHIAEETPHVGVVIYHQYRAPFLGHTSSLTRMCSQHQPPGYLRAQTNSHNPMRSRGVLPQAPPATCCKMPHHR